MSSNLLQTKPRRALLFVVEEACKVKKMRWRGCHVAIQGFGKRGLHRCSAVRGKESQGCGHQ